MSICRNVCPAMLIAVLSSGCAEGGPREPGGGERETRADAVHDGWNAGAGDRLFVGMFANTKSQTTCSGVILGTRCVLTSAHCEVAQDYLFSNLNSPNTDKPAKWAKVLRTLDHPSFARAGAHRHWFDLKLAWFAPPNRADPAAFTARDWVATRWSARGAPRNRTPVEIIGYGANRRGRNGDQGFIQIGGGVKRQGRMSVSGTVGPARGAGGAIAVAPNPARAGHFDSGGPIMAGGQAVGITSREAWGAQFATSTAANAAFINRARVFCQPGTSLEVSHEPARIRANPNGTELRPGRIIGHARANRKSTKIIDCGPTVNPMDNSARGSTCKADLAGGRATTLIASDGRDYVFDKWEHGSAEYNSCPCAAGAADADAENRTCSFDSDDYVDQGDYARKGIHCVAAYVLEPGTPDGGGDTGGTEGEGEGHEGEGEGHEGEGEGHEGEGEEDPGGGGEGEGEPDPDPPPCPNIPEGDPCPPPADGEGEGEGVPDPAPGCGADEWGWSAPCFTECFHGERWCDEDGWGECMPILPDCAAVGCDDVDGWAQMCPDCLEGEMWPCDAGDCRFGEMICIDGRMSECVDLEVDCADPGCCAAFHDECGFEDPDWCMDGEPPPEHDLCDPEFADGMTDCDAQP